MRDGFATVYVSWDDFREFVIKHGNFDKNDSLVIGCPKSTSGNDEIEIPVAFSNTDVMPYEWGGKPGEEVNKINETWEHRNKFDEEDK